MEFSNSSLLELETSSTNSSCQFSSSHSYVPLCRQFWKAGEYYAGDASQPVLNTGQNRMRVHPKFLHSNATSHKWAFGAIADLLDNAVDEACNGATKVIVDKIANLGNSHALFFQDDGNGMDPKTIRHCMSFGFSNKQSNSVIGQYGNGFKTSTMRLGADVIVFSRCVNERTLTQSVGILSYTFLRQTGCTDVIVPMVDYIYDILTRRFVRLVHRTEKFFCENLSVLLRWSPFAEEEELLNQFDQIGGSGTRIIIFNLWQNDSGGLELDFDTDEKDIIISGAHNVMHNSRFSKDLNEKHIGNRFHYSLRAYTSILYLRLPENFRIFLRSIFVDPHYVAEDLIYKQCIKYKPQITCTIEAEEIGTVIGFLNGAPNLDIHGFNIYHRYRLIMPFWRVVNKCKGVVGVLQVECLNPTHDKQDFEKSDIFLKLENRLKCMALEYWKYHCHLVGYTATEISFSTQRPPGYQMYHPETAKGTHVVFPRRKRKCAQDVELNSHQLAHGGTQDQSESISHVLGLSSIDGTPHCSSENTNVSQFPPGFIRRQKFHANIVEKSQDELPEKEYHRNNIYTTEARKRQLCGFAPALNSKPQIQIQQTGVKDRQIAIMTMLKRRQQLKELCIKLEKSVEELAHKEKLLRYELEVVGMVCHNLNSELESFGMVKMDML